MVVGFTLGFGLDLLGLNGLAVRFAACLDFILLLLFGVGFRLTFGCCLVVLMFVFVFMLGLIFGFDMLLRGELFCVVDY